MKRAVMRLGTGSSIVAVLLLLLLTAIRFQVSAVTWDKCSAEQVTVSGATFEMGHIYAEFTNNGLSSVIIVRYEIASDDSGWFFRNMENTTSNGSPVSIPPDSTTILDFEYSWVPGRSYYAAIYFSDGSASTYALDTSPTSISGAFLYKANMNFYRLDGSSKIDLDIGNCGTTETEIMALYTGTSYVYSQNQITAPSMVPANGLTRITLGYDWIPNETYNFKAVSSSGQTANWTAQAPSWDPSENENPMVVRVQPADITVKKDDVFTVDIMIENFPAEYVAGVQFEMNWEPTVLNAVNMTELLFHSTMPPGEYDNIWQLQHEFNESLVRYAYTWISSQRARDGGYAPISGNHTLATITFKAVGLGTTRLHFSIILVGDSNAEPTIWSRDEPYARGNIQASLMNHVIIDGNVEVETTRAGDEKTPLPNIEDIVNRNLDVPAATANRPENTPQTVEMMMSAVAAAGAAVLVLNVQMLRRRKD